MYRFATLGTGFLVLSFSAFGQAPKSSQASGEVASLPGGTATFDALGDLAGGDVRSHALGVSADGSVVVGYSESDTGIEAFRWAAGLMEGLGILADGDSRALAASADGSVVVGWSNDEAFRWESGEMVGVGSLPGGDHSLAQDVSADGSVVVGYGNSDNGDNEAFRWEDGLMIGLGDFPEGPFGSWANGVSADGSVIVGQGTKENLFGEYNEAARWEDGEMVGLGFLPGGALFSNAMAISADSSTIVGVADSGEGLEAFRWENNEMEGLGLLGENLNSWAYAVSADGSVVVGSSLSPTEAFIWTEAEGMRDLKDVLESEYGLDLTGWTLRRAQGVSNDGTVIVGEGINPQGDNEGWRAVLTPPPPAPENDDIADAIVLTESDTYEGSNVNATLEDDEPEPSCTWGDWTTNFSVWWSFTATGDGTATINTNGSLTPEEDNLDTILSLHNASDLSEVACDDDGGEEFWSLIEEAPVTQGETYLIRVAGYDQSSVNQGTIQLTTDFQFGVADEVSPGEIAEGLSLPSPNPASGISTFTVAVKSGQDVTVEVFDVTGRRVQTLYDGALASGMRETLTLDASALPAGIYVVRAAGEDFTKTRQVTIVR